MTANAIMISSVIADITKIITRIAMFGGCMQGDESVHMSQYRAHGKHWKLLCSLDEFN